MTPKKRKRLRWVADCLISKTDKTEYMVFASQWTGYNGFANRDMIAVRTTKRQAIAACEKHARERGKK